MTEADKRINELLEANTKYLLRARKSEELLQKVTNQIGLIEQDFDLKTEVEEYLKAPWLIK
jgi:hypothetical protein